MKKIIWFIVLSFLFSCSTTRNKMRIDRNTSQQFDYTEILDPFQMRIASYTSGIQCSGGRAFASECIGVTINNDTIRVLTLCNSDTTFRAGQMILVTPKTKPSFFVAIPESYVTDDNMRIMQPCFKTTYGSLKKMINQ